jgi:lipid-binding SYLF domain-containing protein
VGNKTLILGVLLANSTLLWGQVMLGRPGKGKQGSAASLIDRATELLDDIMSMPERAIPAALLSKCRCVAVLPTGKLPLLVATVSQGWGPISCRTANGGWSAPAFISIYKGKWGLQRPAAVDLILLAMTPKAQDVLLKDRSKLEAAGISFAPGPVGKNAVGPADALPAADILAWGIFKGVIAGITVEGGSVGQHRLTDQLNRELYGSKLRAREIVAEARVPPTVAGASFLAALAKHSSPGVAQGSSKADASDSVASGKAVIEEIRKTGLGSRAAIAEIQPLPGHVAGENLITVASRAAVTDLMVIIGVTGNVTELANFTLRRGTSSASDGAVIRFTGIAVADGISAAGDGAVIQVTGDVLFHAHESSIGAQKLYLPRNIQGFGFHTRAEDPLVFVLLEKYGLVHVSGSGQVTFPDGRVLKLPSSAGGAPPKQIEPER